MFFPLLAFSSYLLFIGPASAQVSAPNCTNSAFAWSFNSLQQSPCLVTAYLAAVCSNGAFNIPALLPQNSYSGPDGLDDSDMCKCNTVVYNLISACDACQGESWIPYSTWSFNCTNKATPGTFPEPVPAGTNIPQWAFIDTSIGDSWNISTAEAAGDSPEVTGSASIVPTSISVSQSTLTPSSSASHSSAASASPSTSHSSSNAGAIAGGVVGGIVGAALIAGVAAWFVIRRRRARSAPSMAYMSGQGGGDMGQPMPYPLTIDAPRFYDPSDPTTYPHPPTSPTIHTTNQSVQYHSPIDLQPNRHTYSGLPEV